MNRPNPKYKRWDNAYILLCDENGIIVGKDGKHYTCVNLKIGKPEFNKEYYRWEYHCIGWLSLFFEDELSPIPLSSN